MPWPIRQRELRQAGGLAVEDKAKGDELHLGTREDLTLELQIDNVRAEQGAAMGETPRELSVWELHDEVTARTSCREAGAVTASAMAEAGVSWSRSQGHDWTTPRARHGKEDGWRATTGRKSRGGRGARRLRSGASSHGREESRLGEGGGRSRMAWRTKELDWGLLLGVGGRTLLGAQHDEDKKDQAPVT